jgi:hypothetical protein
MMGILKKVPTEYISGIMEMVTGGKNA